MRRITATIIVAAGLTCVAHGASAAISAVWANDGEDKVTQDELRATNGSVVANSLWNGQTIGLFGAKNEVINFNLILEAAATSATNVSVSLSNLIGPAGSVIRYSPRSTSNLFNWTTTESELFYVRYLQIKGLSNGFYGVLAGFGEPTFPQRAQCPPPLAAGCAWQNRPVANKFYPDIAVPIELVPTFNIAAGNNQSIWADIYIPKTVTAGLYTGAVTVSENGVATYTVPLQLNVRNFSLADTPNSKTMLYVGAYDVSRRYGGATQLQALTNQMLVTHRHKISLIDDNMNIGWSQTAPAAQWIPFLNGSAFASANGYAGPGVLTSNNVYSIGTYGIMTAGITQNAFTAMLNAWETWFSRNSPLTERFIYLCDEVACQNSTPSLTTQLGWWSAITGAGRNLHTLATQPLLNVAQTALSNPTSGWPYSQGMYPARTNGYTSVDQSAANSVKSKEPFRRLFAYGSTRPGEGLFATEDQGTSPRELPWAQYKKNIDRWFVWNANYYTNYQGGLGDTDVFTTARTFGKPSSDPSYGMIGGNNGDGVLLYPGTDLIYPASSYGIRGPIVSLRLKHWRRGIQDVDYIVLANSINAQAVSALVQQMVPKALWENQCADPAFDCSYFIGPVSWSENPDDWEAARSQLAHIIDGQ